MRSKIEDKYPDILTYGCSSHYLNLLEKEVTPNSVNTEIRLNTEILPHGWLKEKEGHKYREIVREHPETCKIISKKVDDMNIYKNGLDLMEQLKLVGATLDTVSYHII